jgi:hypothetical protein
VKHHHLSIPLAIALPIAACSTEPAPPRAIVADVAPSASASAAPPAAAAQPDKPSCDPLSKRAVEHAKTLIAAALAEARDAGSTGLEGMSAAPPHFIGKCFSVAGAGGVWIVTAHRAKIDSAYSGIELRWSLDYVDGAGARVSVVPAERSDDPKPEVFNYVSSPDTYDIDLSPYDYDGDGAPEIIVKLRGKYHEGEEFSRGRIYTLKAGKIARYSPANGLDFDEARDVDGDGRPDLVVHGPYTSSLEYCGSGFGYRVTGPPLIAHARPDGSFSLDDDAAKKAAREACPSKPKHIVEKGKESDTGANARNVACARIRGVSTAELHKRIAAECRPSKSKDVCPADACTDADLLRSWAALPPPLVVE